MGALPGMANPTIPDQHAHRSPLRQTLAVGVLFGMSVALASANYQVQPGDTLAEIAAEHGVTTAELASANGIADPDRIYAGQALMIPGADPGPAGETIHVVAAGETLASIARQHGTTAAALANANDLDDPDLIWPGQAIAISSGAAPPGPTTHTVQPGESLESIARRYGTTAEAIAATNGITDGKIYEGTRLVIGGEAAPTITHAEGATSVHVVAEGETLVAIAARYGTSPDHLAATNQIADPDLILIGQELTVPDGAWRCPVPGATYFNDWGFPRSGGRFHQGNDLFAPRGTEVRAPVSGTVVFREGTIGGLQFWLEGDDGHLYIGTHLDTFGTGGRVAAGTVIGTVGDSGNALGSRPHVHFEIHVADVPVNPYPTLQAAC